ncbi:MAG: murein biosynthesis integral membrane protein MurJ [Kiritimatiellae bacterium]|nr:murein biosynthesis integral membrane protein MurJ [Kiritimatiellia bacterium]
MTEQRQNSDRHSVLRSASVVGIMTAVSRVLGLVREVAMGYLFGTTPLKSAFDMAFTIPNLFRRLFGEGALSSAFVPLFSESLTKERREESWRFASRVLLALAMLLAAVTAIGIALTFPINEMLPPDSRWRLPMPMLRVMLPYALLICLAATVSGMLNALRSFAIPSLTPFLLNAIWLAVLGTFILFPGIAKMPERQLMILCAAILVAGLAQIFFQWPALRRHGFRFSCGGVMPWRDPRLRQVVALMGPAAIGMGLIQINVCVDKLLAYWVDASAPAALEYAERITYLPLGMFATAFMTVLLPTFSRQAAEGKRWEIRETIERAIRNLGLIMAPCSLALMVLSPMVIRAIYAYDGGKFGDESVLLSSRALSAYAPGLLIFSLQKVMTPAFYGMQDMKTPLKVSMWCLLLNLTLNITSIILLPAGWKHCGIAGSTVFTSLVNCIFLYRLLKPKACMPRLRNFLPSLLKSVLSAALMSASALWFWFWGVGVTSAKNCRSAACNIFLRQSDKLLQVELLAATVLLGVAVYFGLMAAVGRGELKEMAADLMSRKKKRGGKNAG